MKKLIVIEYDPDVISVIRDIFETECKASNISAEFFSSSTQGLKRITEIFPDLIIIDLMMPNLSGFEIVKHIRADKKLKDIPIFVITGYDSPKVRQEIFSYGIDDYIPKPFDIKVFVDKVKRIL